ESASHCGQPASDGRSAVGRTGATRRTFVGLTLSRPGAYCPYIPSERWELRESIDQRGSTMRKTRLGVVAAAVVAGALALTACGSASGADGDGGSTNLSLVGFAVPKAGNDAVSALWAKTPDGEGVTWATS